jgi:hypothetical protein
MPAKKFRHKHKSIHKAILYCVASLQPATPPDVDAFFFSLFSFKRISIEILNAKILQLDR